MISEYFLWLSELCGAGSPLPKRLYLAFDGNLRLAYEADFEKYISLGFSEKEAQQAQESGLACVSIGPRILRCETAPVAAVCAIMYQTGNFDIGE